MASGQQCRRKHNKRRRDETRRKCLCLNYCGKGAQDGLTTCRKCRKKLKKKLIKKTR